MTEDYWLADLEKAVRRLGEEFYRWVQSQMQGNEWVSATHEVRYASDGSYWDDKMRVETVGDGVVSLRTTQPIDDLLALLNKLRKVLGWYSMNLRLDRDGKVTIKYGYDANCTEDPSFFAD